MMCLTFELGDVRFQTVNNCSKANQARFSLAVMAADALCGASIFPAHTLGGGDVRTWGCGMVGGGQTTMKRDVRSIPESV